MSGKITRGELSTVLNQEIDGIKNDAAAHEAESTAHGINNKADKSQVLTNVPANAKFTDTVYSHPGNGTNPHGTTKADVKLSNVDNVKQMPLVGATFTGVAVAQSNVFYTTKQIRNIALKTGTDFTTVELELGDIGFIY